jgi:solute carrier family 25 S-adenosylmethionine transporter 26
MQIGAFNTTSDAIRDIYNKQGIRRGFYAGFSSFIMRDIPFSAI